MLQNFDIIAEPRVIEERHDDWHNQRAKGIGGSESAVVLGYSKWSTPLDVWELKTGKTEPKSDTDVFRRGRIREPQIIQEYSDRTGKTVYKAENLVHPEIPYIHANFDGLVPGDRIIEAKTAGAYVTDWGEEGTEEVPVEYFFQCQHYLMVAVALNLIPRDKPEADLFVSIGGEPIQIYTIHGNPELWEAMKIKYRDFWECVELEIPPAPINNADRLKLIQQSEPESKYSTPEIVQEVGKLKRISKAQTRLQEREDEIKTTLALYAGTCDTVLKKDGKVLYTCKTSKPRVTLDSDRLKTEQPDIYREYSKIGKASRPIRIR